MRVRWRRRGALSSCVVAIAILAAACAEEGPGEERPNVDVIGGGGSVSVSGVVEGYGELLYEPSTDQAANLAIGLDLRDVRELMSAAAGNRPVDWPAVTAIYEGGRNQTLSNGSIRSLAALAQEELPEVFPNGVAVFGRDDFIDGIIRDALMGAGRATGLGDNARRQIVDRGVQMLEYGHGMQHLAEAQRLMAAGSASEAAAEIDAAWATVTGAREESTTPNHGILATGLAREEDFLLHGQIARPLESYLYRALVATQQGNLEEFEEAVATSRSFANTIFYLSVLRDARVLAGDSRVSDRQTHLAEGWTFFEAIRPQVAAASPEAAALVEEAFTRSAEEAFPADLTEEVYAALNEPAVLEALGIPEEFQFTSPAQ